MDAPAHLSRQPLPANVWEGVYVVAKIVALMYGVESALKAVGGGGPLCIGRLDQVCLTEVAVPRKGGRLLGIFPVGIASQPPLLR